MATTRLMTADDLLQLPEDGRQHELREGVLVRMSTGGAAHSELGVALAAQLYQFVRQHRVGKVYGSDIGFVLARDPDTVLAPDAAFVKMDRLPPIEEQIGYLPLSPDLAVEILSPSNRAGEIADKVRRYLEAGSLLVWVIDPVRYRATVYQTQETPMELGEDGVLDGGNVLPGFRVALTELWPSSGDATDNQTPEPLSLARHLDHFAGLQSGGRPSAGCVSAST